MIRDEHQPGGDENRGWRESLEQLPRRKEACMAPYSAAAPPPQSARNAAVLRDGPHVTPSANAGAAIARAAHLLGDVMPACHHHSNFR